MFVMPTCLGDWTPDLVSSLVERGVYESEVFDLKEMLPHPNDQAGKRRLIHSCAAFANSDGGFLLFGIKDGQSLPTAERIVGLASAIDFPERFGNYPQQCQPSVSWDFLNPPLTIAHGRVLHIVHIPRSWKTPHACGSPNNGFVFPKRTNQGTDWMSYEEVRQMFLGYYEKRIKLQLLRSELIRLRTDVAQLIVDEPRNDGNSLSSASPDLQVIESVLADVFSVIYEDQYFLDLLGGIRTKVRSITSQTNLIRARFALPLDNLVEQVQNHNRAIRNLCLNTVHAADQAIERLDAGFLSKL